MIDALTLIASSKALDEKLLTCKQPKLFLVDIQNFKAINLAHGDEGGDFVLRALADELLVFAQANMMETFRVKDDQFALLMDIPFELAKMEQIIFALSDAFGHKTYHYNGVAISFETHIGISFDHFHPLAKTYKALLVAKAQNQPFATYSEFANTLMEASEEEAIQTITRAIETGKIVLLFQAIVNHEKTPCYYEALLRLECDQELQSPKLFLEIAREKNLYDLLLRSITNQITTLLKQHPQMRIGINFSLEDILNTERITFLKQALAGYPVIFEIQADTPMLDPKILAIIETLKKDGFGVALDNVSETSLVETLKEGSVDYVKMHGDIIRNLLLNATAKEQCNTLLNHCHNKKLKTVATYINAQSTLEAVQALPFDLFQGYSFEQPHLL